MTTSLLVAASNTDNTSLLLHRTVLRRSVVSGWLFKKYQQQHGMHTGRVSFRSCNTVWVRGIISLMSAFGAEIVKLIRNLQKNLGILVFNMKRANNRQIFKFPSG